MTARAIAEEVIDLSGIRAAVDQVLEEFLAGKARSAGSGPLADFVDVVRGMLRAGGKRVRPVLCVCGWHAAGGGARLDEVLRAAASLELFHTFALIHDDVIDGSDTRRGMPTAHRIFQAGREGEAGGEEAARFGTGSAILLGDLTLVWSYELLAGPGLAPASDRVLGDVLGAMRTEATLGQYLDLRASGQLDADLEGAMEIVRYKTAKYTIERPLHVGAVLAGAGSRLLEACTAYALPVGEAFQLRDDLLGVFGQPGATGKSDLDDLRAGKRTPLVAVAMQRAGAGQRMTLTTLLGQPGLGPHEAAAIRSILEETGARAAVEEMIAVRYRQALRSLDLSGFPAPVVTALRDIAHRVTARSS
jgi:geranylgeranyl diphosphate synthase, type I